MKYSILLLVCTLASVLAHPEHDEDASERQFRREYKPKVAREFRKCAAQLERRGIQSRAAIRRAATMAQYRGQLMARDTDTVTNKSHQSSAEYTSSTSPSTLFSSSNTCVLNPEGEVGPFFVKGEYVRKNLREEQDGVPIVIEAQFLDVETCEPIVGLWWDIWNCNATGVYSGVVQNGNGNGNDASNINTTFLRGIQQTDSDGVVTFESIFPGHYSGRATHHHVVAHLNAEQQSNGTITGGTVAHIGQLFWDQDLITKVEATSPYNTNTISITENASDRVFADETEDTDSDPVFNYDYIGSDISDGIFGWVQIIVNTSASYDPTYSFALTADGGIQESGGSGDVVSDNGGTGEPGGGSGGPSSPSGASVAVSTTTRARSTTTRPTAIATTTATNQARRAIKKRRSLWG